MAEVYTISSDDEVVEEDLAAADGSRNENRRLKMYGKEECQAIEKAMKKKEDAGDDVITIDDVSMVEPTVEKKKLTSTVDKKKPGREESESPKKPWKDPNYEFLGLDDEDVEDKDLRSTLDEIDRMIEESNAKRGFQTMPITSDIRMRSSSPLLLPSDDDDDDDDGGDALKTSSQAGAKQVAARQLKRKLTDDAGKSKEERDSAKKAREELKQKKEADKEKKRHEMQLKRQEKEREKEARKIEREMSASLNSKCEQYTFCHVGRDVVNMIADLEATARTLFAERNVAEQLRIDDALGTRIEWHRKCVDMRDDVAAGRPGRFEYTMVQDFFAVVVPSDSLKAMIDAATIVDFVVQEKAKFGKGESSMIVVSHGRLKINKKKLYSVVMELFSEHRTQILEAETSAILALAMAQFLRSLSRREKKRNENRVDGKRYQYLGDKGSTSDVREDLVKDWWDKMLATIDRISDAQRRAIVKFIPDPIKACLKYSKMEYRESLNELSGIVAENNRRVGPAMAHRLLMMLTDQTGEAVID